MLLTLLYRLFGTIISIVDMITPSWALPSFIYEPIQFFFAQLSFYNAFLPLNACMISFFAIFSFEMGLFLVRIVLGFASLVRGGGKIEI